MHDNVRALIESLELQPHPEGGWYRETHRAPARVNPVDGRGERAALTVIWFLLAEGERSRWHRVRSDEVWLYCEGDPLTLFEADAQRGAPAPSRAQLESVREHTLGPRTANGSPVHVIPANAWQAARTTGAYTLVSCIVAPGFDFADFEMVARHDANP